MGYICFDTTWVFSLYEHKGCVPLRGTAGDKKNELCKSWRRDGFV